MPPPQDSTAAAPFRGRLLIAAAAVLWSTSGFFAKAPLFEEWPLVDEWGIPVRGPLLAFWRAAFASLALLPMVRRPRWSPRLIPMVLVFAVMNFCYLSSMAAVEPSIAIWLQNTAPLWVFLVGVFIFKEAAQPRDWLLLALCGAGLAVILTFQLAGGGAESMGVVLGFFSGVTYAGIVLSLRMLRHFDAAWLVALCHVVTALLFLPYVIATGIWPQGWQWLYLAAFGMLQMGIPYLLFARGLRSITGHEAAGIALLEPILVPAWVLLAWGSHESYEPPEVSTLIGGGLILTGLVLRYLGVRRRPAP